MGVKSRSRSASLRLPYDAQAQLVELRLRDGRGRVEERIVPGLRLRESLDLADVLRPRERHADPLDPAGEPALRRSAVFEGIEDGPESLLGLVLRDAHQLEDALLHGALMDADAPTGRLAPVEREVVLAAAGALRLRVQEGDLAGRERPGGRGVGESPTRPR